ARAVTGRPIPMVISDRRSGDPARLVADARLAHQVLGWAPVHTDLAQIIADAWHWECRSQKA
ncbi:MAG: UDP-glucose 4-epimerase GalE, partial [Halothiobacillus sp.]|nr:UDP-glucose 4-epimerase GalE [Halothiobacillus sp.]